MSHPGQRTLTKEVEQLFLRFYLFNFHFKRKPGDFLSSCTHAIYHSGVVNVFIKSDKKYLFPQTAD